MGFTPDISLKVREKMQALGLGSSSPRSNSGGGGSTSGSGAASNSDVSATWGLGKKRIAVAAENPDAVDITNYAKPESVRQLIHIAIKDNMLFSGLPPAGLAAVIDSMQPRNVIAGKDIIKQVSCCI
eukprot:GHRR01026481.1.p1 GENE.GHRR01026481.1~~GHRR01026481.1.p1  ORF type:complete len:127 (+),score=36.78 GHRR01026481.1:277-657(+)